MADYDDDDDSSCSKSYVSNDNYVQDKLTQHRIKRPEKPPTHKLAKLCHENIYATPKFKMFCGRNGRIYSIPNETDAYGHFISASDACLFSAFNHQLNPRDIIMMKGDNMVQRCVWQADSLLIISRNRTYGSLLYEDNFAFSPKTITSSFEPNLLGIACMKNTCEHITYLSNYDMKSLLFVTNVCGDDRILTDSGYLHMFAKEKAKTHTVLIIPSLSVTQYEGYGFRPLHHDDNTVIMIRNEIRKTTLINEIPAKSASSLSDDDPAKSASSLLDDDPTKSASSLLDDDPAKSASYFLDDDPANNASSLLHDDNSLHLSVFDNEPLSVVFDNEHLSAVFEDEHLSATGMSSISIEKTPTNRVTPTKKVRKLRTPEWQNKRRKWDSSKVPLGKKNLTAKVFASQKMNNNSITRFIKCCSVFINDTFDIEIDPFKTSDHIDALLKSKKSEDDKLNFLLLALDFTENKIELLLSLCYFSFEKNDEDLLNRLMIKMILKFENLDFLCQFVYGLFTQVKKNECDVYKNCLFCIIKSISNLSMESLSKILTNSEHDKFIAFSIVIFKSEIQKSFGDAIEYFNYVENLPNDKLFRMASFAKFTMTLA